MSVGCRKLSRRDVAARIAAAVLLLLAVCIPPLFVNHPIGYVPLITVLLVYLFNGATLLVAKRTLRVSASFDEGACVRGEQVGFVVHLENSMPLMLFRVEPCFYVSDVFGHDDREVRSSTVLTGHEKSDFRIAVTLAHVGTYAAGLRDVRVYDPMGLFNIVVPCDAVCEVEALPRIVRIADRELPDVMLQESVRMLRPVAADDIDYAGVRDYRIGDSLKSIHWKLSARNDEYLTRLFEVNTDLSVAIVLDFFATAMAPELLMECNDALVESALSIDANLRARGNFSTLMFVDRTGQNRALSSETDDELQRAFVQAPVVSPTVDSHAALSILRGLSQRNARCGCIVCCSTHLSNELVDQAMRLRRSGRNVSMVCACARSERKGFERANRGAVARLTAECIDVHIVSAVEEFAAGKAL